MALNDTLKTRILLRNDTLSNWEGSHLKLGKGEIAIATGITGGLAEVRVGTGTSTWATSEKLKIDTAQVSGLTELIESLVGNGAKKYKVVANGADGNSWKLQEAPLSATDNEWVDVTGSTAWTVDFSGLSYNGGSFGATKFVTKVTEADGVVSAEYAQPAISDINGLQTALDAKLDETTFLTISRDIGLSAASKNNPVATKNDIASLDGVMHFKGTVNDVPTTTGYNVGDVVLVAGSSVEGDNGKEFVLVEEVDGTKKWEQIGDQDHYATKSYVDTGDSNTLNAAKSYTDGKIIDISGTITADYATKTLASQMSAYALEQANDHTDSKFAGLSDYYTKDEVNAISTALSTDYSGKIKAVDDKLADYALSANVTSEIAAAKSEVIGTASDLSSASTVNGAKAYAKDYADQKVAELGSGLSDYIKHGECVQSDLSGYFILDCGGSAA